MTVPKLNGKIDRVAIEIDIRHPSANAHFHAKSIGLKVGQARDQPFGRESGVSAQPKCTVTGVLEQLFCSGLDGGKGRHYLRGIGLTNAGEANTMAFSPQQFNPEIGFQDGDLTAHGRLSDMQFMRGRRQVFGARHGLEDAQWVKRRSATQSGKLKGCLRSKNAGLVRG